MRRRFQDGGLATATDDEGFDRAGGALDPTMMLSSILMQNMTTTPEARAWAEKILTEQMSDKTDYWNNLLQGKKDNAEQVRQALRTARERLQAQEYNRGEMLLAASQALGAPTRTGALGETASNVFGALREPLAKRREFSRNRDSALTELDLAEANVNNDVTNSEFELAKLRATLQNRLAVEALDTMGKTTVGAGFGNVIPASIKALDTEYVKQYLPFISGGDARAAAGLDRLRFVSDYLKRGKDALTGPYIGAIANIPGVGRWLQGYVSPTSADLRDLVERTIQEDLRPTLGSQFTEREGENLIARSYNTSLEEPRNARRIDQLIAQIEEAYKNQVSMADWFTNHQTLMGFRTPKLGYTAGDFKFDDEAGDTGFNIDDPASQLSPEARRSLETGSGLFLEPDTQLRSRGGPVRRRYQEGGLVLAGDEPGAESTLEDDLKSLWDKYGDPVGSAVGVGTGLAANAAADTVLERVIGGKERRIADAISRGGLDPIAVAEDIKRNRRAGVPETLMDTDTAGIRALTEEAFKFGDASAEEALRELRNRLEGGRERVNSRVNAGLKPFDYFSYENKLSQRIGGVNQRTPEMQSAMDKYPAVPLDPVLSEVVNTPEGKRALEWAFRFYDNAPGRKAGTTDRKGMLTKPSLEFYDYLRKGFNQVITREERMGETEFGGVLRDLRKLYLDRLDEIAPEYKVARESQGDDLEIRDALGQGRKFMTYQPEQLAERAKTLNFHQRNAFRTGMAQSLYETLDRASGENFNAAQRIAGSPALMARLEPFFDSPQEFKIFQTALEREAELARVGRRTLQAGERARTAREAERQSPFEYIGKRAGGLRYAVSPTGWALRIFYDRPKMSPKEAQQVLAILRRGRPEEMNAFANRVRNLGRLRSTKWGRRGAAAAIGAGIGALLGSGDEDAE